MFSKLVFPLFFLFLFFLSTTHAQETLSSVQRQIDRVEKEIAREKKLHKQDKEKAEAFEKQKVQKKNTLNEQLAKMKTKSQELARQIQRLKSQKGSLQEGLKQYQERRKEVLAKIDEKAEELIQYFQKDFPHQRDKRLQDLQGFRKDLKKGGLIAEEALNRFFSFLSQTIDQGYESEVFSGTYTSTKGNLYDGHYLRLGAVVYTFVSLDGKQVACLLRDPEKAEYYWVDEDLSLELRQQVKKAVQIAQGKAAPELVALPFSLVSNSEASYTPSSSPPSSERNTKDSSSTELKNPEEDL